jgi:hypothetical protein
MRFDTFKELERAFTAGKLGSLPDRLTIGDITFQFMGDRTGDARSIFNKGHKPVVIYQPTEKTPFDHCVVLAWTLNNQSHIVPGTVITVPQSMNLSKDMFNIAPSAPPNNGTQVSPPNSPSAVAPPVSHPEYEEQPTYGSEEDAEEDMNMISHLGTHPMTQQTFNKAPDKGEKMKQDLETRTIGKSLDIVLIGFNRDQPIRGKVDSGAVFCSLHAENVQVKRDPLATGEEEIVSFVFNQVKYSMNLEQYQAISSADGGVEQRPVVRFDVRIKDAIYHDILFNLNDRSHMQDPLLLGTNLLEKGKFLIDPTKESIDWAFIDAKLRTLLG